MKSRARRTCSSVCSASAPSASRKACLPAILNADLTPGVVCLLEGIWADLDESGVDRGGAANLFTSTQGTSAGTAAVMHAVGVEVMRDAG